MRKLFIALILVVMVFGFASCNKKTIKAEDIKYIEIRQGSFKAEYQVDEQIDFSNVFIVIALKEDKGQTWKRVDASMVEGFDTSTTTGPGESRIMRVKYLGLYTSDWHYIVKSDYSINTKSRITMSEEKNSSSYEIKLSIKKEDIPSISAITMTVNYDNSKLAYDNSVRTLNSGWKIESRNVKTNSFSFVYYTDITSKAINQDCELLEFTFNVIAQGDALVEIKNIVVSDGESDINLPNIKNE